MADGFQDLGVNDWAAAPLPTLGVNDWVTAAPPPPAPEPPKPTPPSSILGGMVQAGWRVPTDVGGGLVRGVGGIVSSVGTVIANAAKSGDASYRAQVGLQTGLMNRVDAGENVPMMDDPLGYGTPGLTPEQKGAMRQQMEADIAALPRPQDSLVGQIGSAIQSAGGAVRGAGAGLQAYGEAAHPLTEEEQARLSVKGVKMVGGLLPLIGAAVAGGLPAVMGYAGIEGFGEHYDAAKQAGASDEDAAVSGTLGGLASAGMMAVPVHKAMEVAALIPNAMKGQFVSTLVEMAKSGATMIGFSQLQTVADNVIAKEGYDPNRPVTQGVGNPSDMLLQGTVGALLPGVGAAMNAGAALSNRAFGRGVPPVDLSPNRPGPGPGPIAPDQRVIAAPDVDSAIQAAQDATAPTPPPDVPDVPPVPPVPPEAAPRDASFNEPAPPPSFGGGVEQAPDGGYQFRQTDAAGAETVHPIVEWDPDTPAAPGSTTITPDTAAAIRDHYAAAGVKTVFYQQDPALPFDGTVDPAHPDTLFLSNDPTRNIAQVAGHEFTHVLQSTTLPDGTSLGDLLNQQIAAGITPAGQRYAAATFGATAPDRGAFPAGDAGTVAHASAVQSHLISELGADIGGEAPKFQSFIPRVLDAIKARFGDGVAGNVLRKLTDGLQSAMETIRGLFGETGTRSQNWVTNIGEIHDTLAQMYAARFGEPVARDQANLAAARDRAERDRVASPSLADDVMNPPHSQPEAPGAVQAAPTPAKIVDLSGMGKSIGENLRASLWDRVQAGETTEAGGQQSNLLAIAKSLRGAGGLQTEADFRAFMDAVGPLLSDRTPGWQERLLDAGRPFAAAGGPERGAAPPEPGAAPTPEPGSTPAPALPGFREIQAGARARTLQLRRWLDELAADRNAAAAASPRTTVLAQTEAAILRPVAGNQAALTEAGKTRLEQVRTQLDQAKHPIADTPEMAKVRAELAAAAAEPEHQAMPPAPADLAQGEDWWKKLAAEDRQIALDAAGLKSLPTTRWQFLSLANRARLLAANRAQPPRPAPVVHPGLVVTSLQTGKTTHIQPQGTVPPPPPEPPTVDSTAAAEPPPRQESTSPPEPERPAGYGAGNKTFTAEMAARARARLREKFGRLNAGFDPEMARDGLALAGFHIEAGARKFLDYAKEMIADLGEAARPHLAQWYTAVRMEPGFDTAGMDDHARVETELKRMAETPIQAQEARNGDQGRVPDHAGGERPEGLHGDAPDGDTERLPTGGQPPGAQDAGADIGPRPEGQVREPTPSDGAGGGGTGAGSDAGVRPAGAGSPGAAGGHPGDVDRPDSAVQGKNFVIEPGALEEARGRTQKARDNLAAIRLVRLLTDEGRPATMAEQGVLAKYVGWGGLAGAFPDSVGAYGKDFAKIGPELRSLLSDHEHAAASSSTQFAHYTAEHVIRSMWQAVEGMGFKGGSVFEPGMGVGHFLGMAPPDVAANMRYRGVEMDPMTASIAKLLYPEAGVSQADFTAMPLPEKAFDLVIGNPPFSDTRITSDEKYRPQRFMLHDYFFAKSLDAVRPGGLLAFVTSAGTMNKLDTSARQYLAERAEFVGGVRMPSNAFKQNAGTEVTTDILFFKRRAAGDIRLRDADLPPWTATVERNLPTSEGRLKAGLVNRYFSENPAQVLGKEGFFDKLYKDRYAVHSPPGTDLPTSLREAIERLPRDVMEEPQTADQRAALDFASGQTKDGSYYLDPDGKLMQYAGGAGRPVAARGAGEGGMTQGEQHRVRALVPMRDALRDVFRHDLSENAGAAAEARTRLNAHYDAFVAAFGPINKAEFQYRRPTGPQQETGRAVAREEARANGELWQEGSFSPSPADLEGKSKQALAKERQAMRDEYAGTGRVFDEGSFDPADMPDVVIERRPNIKPFSADPESYRLRSIERYNDETGEAAKKPIFYENVIGRAAEPALASANDGVLWSLNQLGKFDLDAVAAKMGRDRASIVAELGNSVFKLPGTLDTYVSRDEYLSGDIMTKLELARAAAGDDPDVRRNVEALEEAAPKPLDPSRITMTLGMPWVPTDIIDRFVRDVLQLGTPRIAHVPGIGAWTLDAARVRNPGGLAGWDRWSVGRYMNAHDLLRDALNGTSPQIYRTERNAEGRPVQVFDKVATQAAVDKCDALRTAFSDWLDGDREIKDGLAALYNGKLNRDVLRRFDGSYLTTPGVVASWRWRPHQTSVVARIIQVGNTYMAHAVGAGKTSAMIGAGMEMRRLGLVKKPMYVVPNHMLGQFTKEFYEQYPTARIAVADEERFHTDRRRQFVANIAVDDLDAVIITHSSFGFLPISGEFQQHIVSEEIDLLRQSLAQLDKVADRISVKKLENRIDKLREKLSARGVGKTDKTFTFEETGVDFLFVDEAHEFRKLAFATRQSNVKGIDSDGSDKAWDLYTKARYLEQQRPGRSLVLASGTPVTNTMGELYSLSRFIQPQALASRGLTHFDSWAQTFGTMRSEQEETAAGTYQSVTRFNQFVNLYELYKMVAQQMDVVTSKDLSKYVVRPELAGGGRQFHIAQRSPELDEYQQGLAARMAAIARRKGPPKKGQDIILNVINDGRHMAIDPRFVLNTQSDPKSKLNVMLKNVARIYHESVNQEFFDPRDNYQTSLGRGPATQMIFANMGVNPRGPMEFSGYRWMKWSLVAQGVKPSEIAYIGDAKDSTQRQKLFNDMNRGIVRILIGSVKKMGTGVNAQQRLLALHNEDPLWYPADDDQRNGRMLRQGNTNPLVQIHDYSTKGTYDSQMWKLMAKKAGFIEQFFRGDPNLRTMEDLGEASYMEQASAMTTSDDRLITLAEMKQELQLAQRREDAYDREQYEIRNEIKTQHKSEQWRLGMADLVRANIATRLDTRGNLFRATIGTQEYSKRSEAAAALETMTKNTMETLERDHTKQVGSLGGFPLFMRRSFFDNLMMYLQGKGGADGRIDLEGLNAAGIIASAETRLRNLEGAVDYHTEAAENAKRRRLGLEGQVDAPFDGRATVTRLTKEVADFQQAILDDPKNERGNQVQAGPLQQGRYTTLDPEGRMVEEHPLYDGRERTRAQFSPRVSNVDPIAHIHNLIAEEPSAAWGIRISGDAEKPGAALRRSKVWDDGTPTNKLLSGTSAVGIEGADRRAIETALGLAGIAPYGKPWQYYPGEHVALVKGDSFIAGYDDGERIIRNARVVSVYRKADAGPSGLLPIGPGAQFSPKITGAQRESAAYTPEQKQAYENVGRITDAPTIRERWDKLTDDLGRRFIAAVVDPYIGIKADDPAGYMALRNANTTSGALLKFMGDGTLKFDGSTYAMADRNGGVEHNLIRPLHGEENRFIWWVAAHRAERLSREDRENLWSPQDIATLKGTNQGTVAFDYKLTNGSVTRSREKIYLDSLRKLDIFNRNTLDLATQSGLISSQAASVFLSNPFYVPFYRQAEGDNRFTGGGITGGFVKQYAFKTLKGGTEKLNHDLWQNAIGNWAHMIDASLRNRAAAGVLDVAVTNGAAIERTSHQVDHMTAKEREGLVWVMNNGQQQSFQVTDPLLFTAITALDFTGFRNPVMKAMGKFKTLFTMGVTADPRFMLRVAIKDAEQAVAVTNTSTNIVANIYQGFKMGDLPGALQNVARVIAARDVQRLRLSDEAANAMAGGATMHLGSGHDTGHRKVNLDTMLDNPASIARFWAYIAKVAQASKEVAAQSEDVQRLALYRKLAADGVPHDQAAFAGRDLEDITLRGAAPIVRALTQIVPFLNPMLQGLYKVGRSAADQDRNVAVAVGKRVAASTMRRVALVLAATTLLTLALDALYGDDEDYKKRTDEDRNTYFWFKFGSTQFRIPMGFEIAALSRIAANGIEAMFGANEMTPRRFLHNVGSILSDNLFMSPVPQAVAPMLDIYANKNDQGSPIVPKGLEKLQSQQQYTPASTLLARGLSSAGSSVARAIGGPQAGFLAPVQIDHLVDGYFGWLGTMVTHTADIAVRTADQAQAAARGVQPMEPVRASRDLWNFATGGMIATEPTPQSRYVDMMYQQSEGVNRAFQTYHDLIARGDAEGARAYFADNKGLIGKHQLVETATAAESRIGQQIKRVEASPTLTADQKHDQVARYNALRNKVAEQLFGERTQ